jgi:hypothetical protein
MHIMNYIKKFLNLEYYVSPLDAFLEKYVRQHPRLSASQRAEKDKYELLNKLRDTKTPIEVHQNKLWDKF